jgi:Helix-turn-helix domain
MTAASSERPFTVGAAAEHLACSEANVRILCRAGKLRHFRVGCSEKERGPIRIAASAMREYIEQCASPRSEEPSRSETADDEVGERHWGARLVRL